MIQEQRKKQWGKVTTPSKELLIADESRWREAKRAVNKMKASLGCTCCCVKTSWKGGAEGDQQASEKGNGGDGHQVASLVNEA